VTTASYTDSRTKLNVLDYGNDIPNGWSVKRSRWLFKTVDERSASGTEDLLSVSEHRGVVKRNDINVTMFKAESYEGYKLCSKGDLVINSLWAWSRGLGFSDYHGIVSTAYSVYRLRNPEENEYHFLNYLLRTQLYVGQYSIKSKGIWKSRLQLSDYNFLDIPILVPPKSTQSKIVNYLDDKLAKIDSFIANKQQLIEKLQERKNAVINYAILKGINKNVKTKPSNVDWLGSIPEHWVVEKMRYAHNYISRGVTASYVEESEVKVVNQSNFSKGYFDYDNLSFQDSSVSGNEKSRIKKGDILLASTGGGVLGKVWYFTENYSDYLVADSHVTILRVNHKAMSKYIYYLLLVNYDLINGILAQGATNQIELQAHWLKNLLIALPPKEEQKQIISYIESETRIFENAIDKAAHQIKLIKEYRDSLITHAVTGQIEIKE
jgi:type I restriction enzyme S subunit